AGRYEIIDLIGAGGMGAVYSARHTLSQREVALKVIHPAASERPAAAARFQREVSAAAKVGHPGLVQVLDAGRDEERKVLFLVMELLEGETLKDWLSAHRAPSSIASATPFLELFAELLEPVGALHSAGFVHRDLKPENVFITQLPRGNGRVKVLDFGLTREVGTASDTRTGTALGTPHYMAPEQSMSAKDATPAADVWALGVMLYEGVTGQRPFSGETPNAVLVAACTTAHTPVENRCPWLPEPLVRLINTCLSKRPEERLKSAGEMLARLRDALGTSPNVSSSVDVRILNPQGNIALLSTLDSDSASADSASPQVLELDNTLLADTLEETAPTSEGRSANRSLTFERPNRGARFVAAAVALGVIASVTWFAFPRDTAPTEQSTSLAFTSDPPAESEPANPAAEPVRSSSALPSSEAPPEASAGTPSTAAPQTTTPSTAGRLAGGKPTGTKPKGSSTLAEPKPRSSSPTAPQPKPDDDPGFMQQWK
ncbi:MAG: protein kinase, partial [Myxococcales bacterium]|nr:protein kinase [Myxococcales bacterium]